MQYKPTNQPTKTSLTYDVNSVPNLIAANSQPFSYYSGPATKHPLIQKYLYWPLGSGSTTNRKSSDANAASQLKTAYTDGNGSSGSRTGSSKLEPDKNNLTQNGKQVSFNLSTSLAASNQSEEQQARATNSSGPRYEPRSQAHSSSPKVASIYSRMLSTGRSLRYGKGSSNER